jgi:hypothetical protein
MRIMGAKPGDPKVGAHRPSKVEERHKLGVGDVEALFKEA